MKREATPRLRDKARFFATPAAFRAWLETHHRSVAELWVGFHRKASGRQSITWPESVDEALCFGWIDGIRKAIDKQSYAIRFTPRRAQSNWSAVNIARVQALKRDGRMSPAGMAAFVRRRDEKSATYSFENRDNARLTAEQEREFQRHPKAWRFFQAQPPGYRRTSAWWVISPKREETRQDRLKRLIRHSQAEQRIY